jgi:thiol-disulfide isomerase/thioredoxin
MRPTTRVLLVALAAGTLGAIASLVGTGPGPLLRTETGQRLLGRWFAATAPAAPPGIAVASRGQPLPTLALPRLGGGRMSLPQAAAGRPLLINVWASWCGPCIREMPELQRFSAQQDGNGTQVIGIALDDEASVRAFLRQVPVAYPILLDTPGPADAGVRLGNPRGVLPYTALVGADGRLLKQRIGPFGPGEIDAWARAD